jgi:hypothetical protein
MSEIARSKTAAWPIFAVLALPFDRHEFFERRGALLQVAGWRGPYFYGSHL